MENTITSKYERTCYRGIVELKDGTFGVFLSYDPYSPMTIQECIMESDDWNHATALFLMNEGNQDYFMHDAENVEKYIEYHYPANFTIDWTEVARIIRSYRAFHVEWGGKQLRLIPQDVLNNQNDSHSC